MNKLPEIELQPQIGGGIAHQQKTFASLKAVRTEEALLDIDASLYSAEEYIEKTIEGISRYMGKDINQEALISFERIREILNAWSLWLTEEKLLWTKGARQNG